MHLFERAIRKANRSVDRSFLLERWSKFLFSYSYLVDQQCGKSFFCRLEIILVVKIWVLHVKREGPFNFVYLVASASAAFRLVKLLHTPPAYSVYYWVDRPYCPQINVICKWLGQTGCFFLKPSNWTHQKRKFILCFVNLFFSLCSAARCTGWNLGKSVRRFSTKTPWKFRDLPGFLLGTFWQRNASAFLYLPMVGCHEV